MCREVAAVALGDTVCMYVCIYFTLTELCINVDVNVERDVNTIKSGVRVRGIIVLIGVCVRAAPGGHKVVLEGSFLQR